MLNYAERRHAFTKLRIWKVKRSKSVVLGFEGVKVRSRSSNDPFRTSIYLQFLGTGGIIRAIVVFLFVVVGKLTFCASVVREGLTTKCYISAVRGTIKTFKVLLGMLVWRKLHVLAYHNHSSASCAYETKYWTDLENDAIFFSL